MSLWQHVNLKSVRTCRYSILLDHHTMEVEKAASCLLGDFSVREFPEPLILGEKIELYPLHPERKFENKLVMKRTIKKALQTKRINF